MNKALLEGLDLAIRILVIALLLLLVFGLAYFIFWQAGLNEVDPQPSSSSSFFLTCLRLIQQGYYYLHLSIL